jgi:hypothetical protein
MSIPDALSWLQETLLWPWLFQMNPPTALSNVFTLLVVVLTSSGDEHVPAHDSWVWQA